jgi:hypothetical protein
MQFFPNYRITLTWHLALVLRMIASPYLIGRLGFVGLVGLLVDKDDLINYQLLIIYQLLIRTFTYQPTVDKTIVAINQLLTLEGLLMIVDKVWKLTNTVRVGLDARSSHAQTQSTFPDTVCSHCPPCHGV